MNYFAFFITRFWVVWNTILAILPYGFWSLAQYYKTKKIPIAYWVNIFLMVLFLPNSIYLTTDIIHIFGSIPESFYGFGGDPSLLYSYFDFGSINFGWAYNTIMVFLFFLGMYLFWDQGKLLFKEFKLNTISKLIFFSLIAYGVYLGRFVRLNSWDIFVDFTGFLNQLKPSFHGVVFIVYFTIFEVVSYYLLDFLNRTQNLEKIGKTLN